MTKKTKVRVKKCERGEKMRTNYVITIARNFGAGGKTIGLALSKELGIPCYERQILAMASEKSGIDEKLFVDMDEDKQDWHWIVLSSKLTDEGKWVSDSERAKTFKKIEYIDAVEYYSSLQPIQKPDEQ